jgi:hypothetical protein
MRKLAVLLLLTVLSASTVASAEASTQFVVTNSLSPVSIFTPSNGTWDSAA